MRQHEGVCGGMSRSESLRGKRVVVTRPGHQAEKFLAELNLMGAKAIHLPVIRVVSCGSTPEIDSAISSLSSYDWVVFTSVNGVKFFLDNIQDSKSLDQLRCLQLAAIGPATAQVLAEMLRAPDVVPSEYISDAIASALGNVEGKKILLARARQARKVLAENLKSNGAVVSELAVYDVVINDDPNLEELVVGSEVPDFITFTSSSTVHGFYDLLKRADRNWFNVVPAVCIGPITAKTLREYGVEPYRVADEYTVDGILNALSD